VEKWKVKKRKNMDKRMGEERSVSKNGIKRSIKLHKTKY
jgi:hypothetical protein